MEKLLSHRQTKGPGSARPPLNRRAARGRGLRQHRVDRLRRVVRIIVLKICHVVLLPNRNYSESACAESSITSRVTGVAVARVSRVRYLIIRAATRPALRERALRALAGDRMPAVVANLARVLGRANFRVTLV